jgi:hypothetical protein
VYRDGYRTIGFEPAAPGWRAVWEVEDGFVYQDLAGWLILEECRIRESSGFSYPIQDDLIGTDPLPEVIVHAACVDSGEVIDISEDSNLYAVLGPNDPRAEEMAQKHVMTQMAENLEARKDPAPPA